MVSREALNLSRPLYVMAKPTGARCNLVCRYCYYLSKQQFYSQPRHQMSDELLEHFIREYIQAQTADSVLFTWHGGEPLLRPLDFYHRAVELQHKYAEGKSISNCLQTNGTLITEEWARFLHTEGWLVGVSIDGPQELHDPYRRTPQGGPSWGKVMRGIDLLNRFRVEWNAMAVVNHLNGAHPEEFYRFFRDELQCRYLQFTPVVETIPMGNPGGKVSPYSVQPQQWGKFLCSVFDEWVGHDDVGEMFVQIFDATLANWCGITPGVCTMARSCGHAAVMEWNGDVYSCDHFVYPQYKLGNLRERHLVEMMYSPEQMAFGRMKHESLSDECRQCEWLFACNGECPRTRILPDRRSYLCEGYRRFFEHVAPWMDVAKRNIMQASTCKDRP
ncbi:MAG: anaerobic sulfatase-maturation protein [Bacteroidaceae bacterium]|nr:anaerobic sulfatase-maturation protein [Bacteroidaceae bacterium]